MWTCPTCNCTWPAYGTVEAFNKRRIANRIHPGIQCENIVADVSITGIEPH